ncbi:amyloid protein-binding protein 2-like [Anopheles maculipalpis]|uniref:amyloid protein-binding protein 2-like n=1 Tax=Anopheles maculipalpis TaxID=1496333 RepID=UPI0021591BB7|nr:amyloid protein-binding protein 2-like [Anopheles maculipalpis]
MNHITKFWPLSDIYLDRNSSSLALSSKPLYRLAVEALARNFSNNPRCPKYRAAVAELPLGTRLDLLAEMCDYPSLVEVQWEILSDPLLVSDFIKYLSADLTPLVQCLQWLQSVKKPVPFQLFRQYKKLIEEKKWKDVPVRFDYRCGLRIGTFLTETGWTMEAIDILQLAHQHARCGTAEELTVLRQLMRAQTLTGKLINAMQTYDRMKILLSGITQQMESSQQLPNNLNEGQSLQDLKVAVFHSFSLYHFEEQSFDLSYAYGMHSLTSISERSPSRLVIDVLRQLVRACLGRRMHAKAAFILKHAIGLVVQHCGRFSPLYAETLEDLAILLLVCNHVSESVDVYEEAQQIYMQRYGSRNLMLSLAQGNLAYGLCLQAYVTGHRDRALQHVEKSIGNYKRIWPPEHRMLAQAFRLRATMELFIYPTRTEEQNGLLQDESFNHQDIEPLSVGEITGRIRLITEWEKRKDTK